MSNNNIMNIITLLFTIIAIPVNSLNNRIAINYMNTFRTRHDVPKLKHNKTISKYSENWAQHILDTGRFEHSSGFEYGENIAYTYSLDHYKAFVRVTNLFYNEIEYYDYSDPKFDYQTGHFTQLVWKSSTQVGIGMVSNETISVLVVNFYPPGNYQGEFVKNVLPIK